MVPVTARLIAVPLLAMTLGVVASAEKSPRRRTEQLLELLARVKKAPDKGELSEAEKTANRELFARLDVFLDFETMTEVVLRPHVDQLSPEDQVVVRDIFPRLIRLIAYPDAGAFLSGTQVKLGEEKMEGSRAEVPARLVRPQDDIEMAVTFYWRDDGAWRLVDVAFDGAPLSKDYQNQVGRVIEEKGAAGLLRKLRKRLKKELRSVR